MLAAPVTTLYLRNLLPSGLPTQHQARTAASTIQQHCHKSPKYKRTLGVMQTHVCTYSDSQTSRQPNEQTHRLRQVAARFANRQAAQAYRAMRGAHICRDKQ